MLALKLEFVVLRDPMVGEHIEGRMVSKAQRVVDRKPPEDIAGDTAWPGR
jgi:hypothetical protein